MKKILPLLAGVLMTQTIISQTLTATSQMPVAGDIHSLAEYDTVSAIPRNIGLNQHWDFSSLVIDNVYVTTYTTPASVPQSSLFPASTLVEVDTLDGIEYSFYKSSTTPSQFELLGFYENNPTMTFTYSNTAIGNIFPMSYGSNFNDTYAGFATIQGFSTTVSGSYTVTGTGTGSITMPGGSVYANILQVKTVKDQTQYLTAAGSTDTFVTHTIQYDYYQPSQKFVLLSVEFDYEVDDSQFYDTTVTILGNKLITVGIQDRNFDTQYAIYPNPAKDNFSIKLSNAANEHCQIEIYNVTGLLVKTVDLGKNANIDQKISLSGLSAGIYVVKTSLGERKSARQLVIE